MKKIVVLALFSTSLFGADFTVSTAVTATQVLPDSNDTGTITGTGSITVTGSNNGVTMNSNTGTITGQQLSNAGAISIANGRGIRNNTGGDEATIINTGTIETTGASANGIFNNTSDSCVITNSGTITTIGSNAYGIYNNGSDSCTLNNSGTITTGGLEGHPFLIEASSSCTINNSGTIIATGSTSYGVYNAGNLSVINNSGTITITNIYSIGLYDNGSTLPTITNSGTITITNNDSQGIRNVSNSAQITNSGTIITTGDTSLGLYWGGANGVLTNSGTISTSGSSSHGINSTGSSLDITNSGVITTTGSSAYAIYSTGAGTVLTNSGIIKSVQSYAINFTGTNPTLILNRGSDIQGPINTVSALNVTVENGLNLRLTIEEQNGFGAINISMPYVKIGNTETIATVDPKSFAMQSDILEDLSDSILDDIYRNADNYINCSFPGQGVWVAGIGTTRRRGGTIETNNWQGGVLVGYDRRLGKENALGGFVGGSWGKGTVGGDIATAPMQSYFGGLTFEQQYKWAFFSAALSAGYFQSSNTRTVFYNLAPNGQQTAKGNSGGGMLTSEIHAEMWLLQPYTFRPLITATLRYAGLYLGSYTESGSSSNLSVSSRNISLIKPKLLLNVAISNRYKRCNSEEKRPYDYEFVKVEYTMQPYVGVAGRFQVGGNTVNSQLLGASLNFSSTAPKNIAELLFGISGNVVVEGSWSVFFNAEGLFDTQRSSRFLGEGGFNYSF